MTTNPKTAGDIKSWLISQGKSKNTSGFVIDYTNPDIATTLAINLCVNSYKGCKVITTERGQEILKDQNLFVDTIEATSTDPVANTMESAKIAAQFNCLVVQPFDVMEMKIIRPWPARFCLIADLLPFASMLHSSVKGLFATVADLDSESTKELYEQETRKFYSDTLKVSLEELEWAHYTNYVMPRFKGIITDSGDPVRHKMWAMLTMRQKSVVSMLHQRHKMTNHKLERPQELV